MNNEENLAVTMELSVHFQQEISISLYVSD
jgi:hypothetical protein